MGVLSQRVALVSGASRGIGQGIALALARAGAAVALNYFDQRHELDTTLGTIQSEGGRALGVQGDVADLPAVERMVAETVAAFGRLDIVVTNAAYSDRDLFYQADLDGFRRTIDVTMWGAFHLLRAGVNQMIRQGEGGAAVVIGSPHAHVPVPRSMAYNMAKAAIEHMACTAAIELVDQRIRVNVIEPGWIDTPGERKFADDATIAKAAERLPWKRLGTPEEIGRGVVFLCDPASDYITGSTLLIDGGITLPWWASRGSSVPE